MMSAETVAQTVVDALRLPENTTVEKIVISAVDRRPLRQINEEINGDPVATQGIQ